MSVPLSTDATTLATLSSLEHRLQRLSFYLTGDTISPSAAASGGDSTAQARLQTLESQLATLTSQKPAVRDLLQLQNQHADLFRPVPSSGEPPTTLRPEEILAIVLSLAPSFPTTASQLSSLKDLPIPPAESSAALIELNSRSEKLEKEQEELDKEVAELRERSAKILQRWFEIGVLGAGEVWAEWEARINGVEVAVRREERRREAERQEAEVYKGVT